MVNSQVENFARARYFFRARVNAKEDFLREILGLGRVAQYVVENGDQAVLVFFDQLFERAGRIVADAEHHADVRVAKGQMPARFADRCHAHLASEGPDVTPSPPPATRSLPTALPAGGATGRRPHRSLSLCACGP